MKRLTDLLIDLWIYDVEVLSSGWVLYTVVPAMFYMAFMMIKWGILTCPLWIPSILITHQLKPTLRVINRIEPNVCAPVRKPKPPV